jgi:hypothetical protein
MFSRRPNAELSHATLQAIRFAQLARHLIGGDARYSAAADPAFYQRLSAGLVVVTDTAIERAALPFFRKQVSKRNAEAALNFFSSPAGRDIAGKLVESEIPELTDAEEGVLSQFKSSPQGAALERFLGDPLVLPAITAAIISHAP